MMSERTRQSHRQKGTAASSSPRHITSSQFVIRHQYLGIIENDIIVEKSAQKVHTSSFFFFAAFDHDDDAFLPCFLNVPSSSIDAMTMENNAKARELIQQGRS